MIFYHGGYFYTLGFSGSYTYLLFFSRLILLIVAKFRQNSRKNQKKLYQLLRYSADIKTLLWMVTTTVMFFVLWNLESFSVWLYMVYLYLSICFSVFAHNHNHLPVWKNRFLNQIHSCWITLFYGFPVFGWIPTHNKNHHRYNNKEKDDTKTYMVSEKNNLLTLLIYPTLSGMTQQKSIIRFYRSQYGKNREQFLYYTLQIICLLTWIVTAFLIDWQKALIYVVIPQQVSLNTVLIFNYLQHVHADEESPYNHSRNIVGWPLNFFLFNNGYHTIHHLHPGLHWSKTPKAHQEIDHLISADLKEKSAFWFVLRVYILGIFFSGLRTKSMRLERKAKTAAAS